MLPVLQARVRLLSTRHGAPAAVSTRWLQTAIPLAASKASSFADYNLSELQQRVKADNEAGKYGQVPKTCVVTGGSGFVGQRLVEMLIERGANRVVSFDLVPPSNGALKHEAIEYVVGDLCDAEAVSDVIKGADCVWHVGAVVGPYHPLPVFTRVNVGGTANVIKAMREHGVPKLVYACSPSTRFSSDYGDMDGLSEEELPKLPQQSYVAEYAKTKAEGELLVREAVDLYDNFLALSCAPHQVYGPRDNLFLPNVMEAAASGKLRIFGDGLNRVSMTYVDNYCHALILSEKALYKGSPSLGQFYICTDGDTHTHKDGYVLLWDEIDKFAVGLGFASIKQKAHLPKLLMLCVGQLCSCIGALIGKVFKLNQFSVQMMTIHRWFRITAAEQELGYRPLVIYEEGRADTIAWFREHWLPTFDKNSGSLTGSIAQQTQRKIEMQSRSD